MQASSTNPDKMCLMAIEEERRKTFKYWPFKGRSSCTVEKMAEAGFYSSGKKSDADLVRCYVCHKELDGWEVDDDPWAEHRKHALACPFVKLGKKPSELSVHDVFYLQKESINFLLNITFKRNCESINERVKVISGNLAKDGLKENEYPQTGGRKRSGRK